MGNSVSTVTPSAATAGIDSYVSELGDIHYEKSLGSARFMKTFHGKQKQGSVVVKVFVKPEAGVSLKRIAQILNDERDSLADIPNAIAYQRIVETDRAGYLIRQYLFSSLYDRISTRPFMNLVEKKWVTYQLLKGLADAHQHQIFHGDIKTENCLVTSWNWVFLSDFAGYKPTFLPEDNPADFSFFFDTSSRRTCYLAPERFYKPGLDIEKQRQAEDPAIIYQGLTSAMDIFSLGCVIAELFSDGSPIFSLSQLFKYRSGEYDPMPYLNKIENKDIRLLIQHMIQLDPTKRFTADRYLLEWRDTAFPKYFYTFLHNYIHSVAEPTGQSPTSGATSGNNINNPDGQEQRFKSEADEKIQRIYYDFDKISLFLDHASGGSPADDSVGSGSGLLTTITNGIDSLSVKDDPPSGSETRHMHEGALIFLSLICSSIRNTAYPSSKVQALDMILSLSRHVPDDIILDRLVPYVMSLLSDKVGLVRAHAVITLASLLSKIETLNVINVKIFPEYILRELKDFPSDPEVLVRSTYAGCVAQLALTSLRFLELAQLLKNEGAFSGNELDGDADGAPYEGTYDSALHDLQAAIEDQIRVILTDPESSVKRALLSNIASLCIFLGKQRANDVLLSHMITYLNDRDWMLRSAFFESIVGVGTFVGGRSLEEYILPLMIQALTDSEEFVVEKVLKSLASLCDLGLFQKMAIWDLVSFVAPLLCHPSQWIRYGAIGFIASTSRRLPVADIWCMIYPIIRPFLRANVGTISDLHLRENVKPPLSRAVFELAVQWATKASRSLFWKPARERPAPPRQQSSTATLTLDLQTGRQKDASPFFMIVKSSEDEQYLDKLRSIGMDGEDEGKLASMREYIWKLSRSRQSARPKGREGDQGHIGKDGTVDLGMLGITPCTVFLSPELIRKDFSGRNFGTDHLRHANSSGKPGNASMFKSSTMSNIPRTSSDSTIFSNMGSKDNSSVSVYESSGLRDLPSVTSDQNFYRSTTNPLRRASLSAPRHRNALQSSGATIDNSLLHAESSSVSRTSTKRTRMLMSPGNAVADASKAAPATSMNETTVQGTIELPANERTVQDVIAGAGVSIPSKEKLQWSSLEKDADEMQLLQSGIGSYNQRGYNPADGGQKNLASLLLHQTLKVFQAPTLDFGPTVTPLSRHRRLQRNATQAVRSQWRPEGTLVAHLAEHKAAVNQICVSPDHNFFVSCSNDGTVKVWDTARLEKNVTNRARMTYGLLGGKVICMTFIDNTHSIAAASDNGNIHILRVHFMPGGKYGKCEMVRKITLDDEFAVTMEHFNTESESLLIYGTNRGNIHAMELGTRKHVWTLRNNSAHGVITAMVTDTKKTWLMVGTNRGVLTLWDLRFKIVLKSWVHPSKSRISRILEHPEPHPPSKSGKIVVAAGKNEVSIWDLEQMECREVFGVRSPDEKNTFFPGSLKATEPPLGNELLKSSFTPQDSNMSADQSVRTVLFPADCDYMIAAGADRKIRYWDTERVETSYVISGLDIQDGRPKYASRRVEGLVVHYEMMPQPSSRPRTGGRSNVITVQQQLLLRNHLDAIMDIALTELPCPMVISGDRDGVIKVYC